MLSYNSSSNKEDMIDIRQTSMIYAGSHRLRGRILAIQVTTMIVVVDRHLLRSDDTIPSTRTVVHRLPGKLRPFIRRP